MRPFVHGNKSTCDTLPLFHIQGCAMGSFQDNAAPLHLQHINTPIGQAYDSKCLCFVPRYYRRLFCRWNFL